MADLRVWVSLAILVNFRSVFWEQKELVEAKVYINGLLMKGNHMVKKPLIAGLQGGRLTSLGQMGWASYCCTSHRT